MYLDNLIQAPVEPLSPIGQGKDPGFQDPRIPGSQDEFPGTEYHLSRNDPSVNRALASSVFFLHSSRQRDCPSSPDYRTDSTETLGYGKHIVRQHNGTISYYSSNLLL